MQGAASIALLLMSMFTQPGNSTADESNCSGTAATGDERYNGTATIASGTQSNRAAVFAGYEHRLYEAEEPLLESDRSVHCDQCSRAAVREPVPSGHLDARWKDLSEPGGCSDAGVDE